ncbi:hypothetical protein [Bremerella alba]|uniref:Uncharacterized protein n=1 Tax=Bremerella alba TaxID=980252 RepID=A0A7V8V4N5_9BACT|nr:hypothetical protein [Bremerella alba]MBA2114884.1 hypothetical protein [Bremerella alba]
MIRPGDVVVYTKTKHTTSPGPRAHDIEPESRGEYYTYAVDKYWIVESVEPDGIMCRTRRGKSHRISLDDPRLRPAKFWEKLFLRSRFPTPA